MVSKCTLRFAWLLVLCSLALSACSQKLVDEAPAVSDEVPAVSRESRTRIGETETLLSADGAFSMKVPASWSKNNSLNDVAVLQAADRSKEAYALLISQPSAPFGDWNLEQFAKDQVQVFVQSIADAQIKGPREVMIDDRKSLQYEISGKLKEVEVVYLYTFLESPDQYMKVLAWSLSEQFEANRESLEEVTSSVRQLKQLDNIQPGPGLEAPSDAELNPAPEASPTPEDPSILR